MSLGHLRNNKSSNNRRRDRSPSKRDRRPSKGGGGGPGGFVIGAAIVMLVLVVGGITYFALNREGGMPLSTTATPSPTAINVMAAASGANTGALPTNTPVALVLPTNTPIVNVVPTNPPVVFTAAAPPTRVAGSSGLDADSERILFAAQDSLSGNYRFQLNMVFDVNFEGETFNLRLNGNGVNVGTQNVASNPAWQLMLNGAVSSSTGQGGTFVAEFRIVNNVGYLQLRDAVANGEAMADTPWVELDTNAMFDEYLGGSILDFDGTNMIPENIEGLPALDEMFDLMDFSDFITLSRLGDEDGGQIARYRRDIDVIGFLVSDQFFEIMLVGSGMTGQPVFADDAQAEQIQLMMASMLPVILPSLEVTAHEYVNINDLTMNRRALHVATAIDGNTLAALMGQIPQQPIGALEISFDAIQSYSGFGSALTVEAPVGAVSMEEFQQMSGN